MLSKSSFNEKEHLDFIKDMGLQPVESSFITAVPSSFSPR
jgi:hypothetical protein